MLNVMTTRARPGMVLALPVFHPTHAGHALLKPGYELDASVLRRLGELKVPSVWIRYPGLEAVVRFISPEVVHEHAQLTRTLSDSLDGLARGAAAALDFGHYAHAVKGLVAKLGEASSRQLLVSEVMAASPGLAAHASAVCFTSLLMGLKLDSYLIAQRSKLSPMHARHVENLGVGALLHDIGITRLAPDVVARFDQTGDESDPDWQAHVRLGVDMTHGQVEPSAAAVIAHHHQRYDGRGFPWVPSACGQRRLSGDEIHVFARIAAVADQYDRVRGGAHVLAANEGRPIPAVRALHEMVRRARRREVDPIVVKALLAVVPAFAPGSMVTLSDGRTAAVVGFDPLHPCRPMVQPVDPEAHPAGLSGEPDPIDLRGTPRLRVVEAEGQPVEAHLFAAMDAEEFDLRYLYVRPGPRQAPPGPAAPPASPPPAPASAER